MRAGFRCAMVVLVAHFGGPASAQQRTGVIGELVRDVSATEGKVIALAKAMPASAYGWRPAPGVRSTGDVFIHIAADNYFLPALAGAEPPAATRIDAKDSASVGRVESRQLTRDQIINELSASFARLKRATRDTPERTLDERPRLSGRNITMREHWITTVTHLHEHLGRLIAYARMKNVTPPCSK